MTKSNAPKATRITFPTFSTKPKKINLYRVNFEVRQNSVHFITGHHKKYYYMVQADNRDDAEERAKVSLKPECVIKSVEFDKVDDMHFICGADQPCEGIDDCVSKIDYITGVPVPGGKAIKYQPNIRILFNPIDKHNQVTASKVIKGLDDKEA